MSEKELSSLFSPLVEELIYKLCSVADENNYDRDILLKRLQNCLKLCLKQALLKNI